VHRRGEDWEHLFTVKFWGNLYDTMISLICISEELSGAGQHVEARRRFWFVLGLEATAEREVVYLGDGFKVIRSVCGLAPIRHLRMLLKSLSIATL
jgi:hypothetical protein